MKKLIYINTVNKRLPQMIYKIIILSTIFMIAGCAIKVKLVGQYDEIIDTSIIELHKKTSSFILKITNELSDTLSYEKNNQFYDEIQIELETLLVRSQIIENGLKKLTLSKNIEELKNQYDSLCDAHKTMTLNKKMLTSTKKAFDQSFRSIEEYIIYLKWNQEQPK